jgi:hypothetical protein
MNNPVYSTMVKAKIAVVKEDTSMYDIHGEITEDKTIMVETQIISLKILLIYCL